MSEDLLQAESLEREPLDLGAGLRRERRLVLVFWQSWCEPCARESATLAAAARAAPEPNDFVGVVPGPDASVDEAEVRAQRAAWGFDFPQVRDRSGRLSRALRVRTTPRVVVLWRDRTVLHHAETLPSDLAPPPAEDPR